jgi:DNA-binding MarR family transcriptional regulator
LLKRRTFMTKSSAPTTPALHLYTGHLLREASSRVSGDLARRIAPEKVTITEWKLLRRLYDMGQSYPSALAAQMNLNSGSVTKLIDKLLHEGLVTRVADAPDRRAHPLSLTVAGRATLPRLAALAAANETAHFGALPAHDREALDRILTILG